MCVSYGTPHPNQARVFPASALRGNGHARGPELQLSPPEVSDRRPPWTDPPFQKRGARAIDMLTHHDFLTVCMVQSGLIPP